MKKIYIFATALVLTFSLKAQYTLTAAQNPVVGEIEKTWPLDTTNLNTGSAGISQIWNYTGISIPSSMAVNSNSYVPPSSAPNASLFPSAVNMAQTSNGTDYGMFGYTNNDVTVYGFSSPSITAIYQNPLKFATLPFTYGNISTDTYSASYTFSTTSISTVGSVTTTADGMGTLNTPGNSYPNVMRIKLQNNSTTTYNGSFTQTTTAVDYVYISSVSKWSLLSISTSTTVNSATTTISKSGSVSDMVLQSISEKNSNLNFSLYPNPTVNKSLNLHYVLGKSENYRVTVYNILGQNVKEINMGSQAPGLYYEALDLSSFPSGVYYIKLKGQHSEGTQKFILD